MELTKNNNNENRILFGTKPIEEGESIRENGYFITLLQNNKIAVINTTGIIIKIYERDLKTNKDFIVKPLDINGGANVYGLSYLSYYDNQKYIIAYKGYESLLTGNCGVGVFNDDSFIIEILIEKIFPNCGIFQAIGLPHNKIACINYSNYVLIYDINASINESK